MFRILLEFLIIMQTLLLLFGLKGIEIGHLVQTNLWKDILPHLLWYLLKQSACETQKPG